MTAIGIDFGTSNIRIAVRGESGEPIPLQLGSAGAFHVPSVIGLQRNPSGGYTAAETGERALGLGGSDDFLVIDNIKRYVSYAIRPEEAHYLPEWWDPDRRLVTAWGSTIDPQDIVADLIRWALRAARRPAESVNLSTVLDDDGAEVTVGCPAYSGYEIHEFVRGVMGRVGRSKFRISNVVEEPNLAAAALARLREVSPGRDQGIILIYDLGGGTFDTAVVEVRKSGDTANLTVLGADCLPFVGGIDIDAAILKRLLPRLADALGVQTDELSETLWDRERSLLLRRIRDAKEVLGGDRQMREAAVTIPMFQGQALNIPLLREDLDTALADSDIVDKTMASCVRAFRRASMYLDRIDPGGFHPDFDPQTGILGESILTIGEDDMRSRIDAVLLVGGSTKMPELRGHLDTRFDPAVIVREMAIDPMTANAIGAAVPSDVHPQVLTRSSYWVKFETGTSSETVYQPYDPYLDYGPREGELPYAVEIEPGDAQTQRILVKDSRDDDEFIELGEFSVGSAATVWFAFDRYGAIHVCGSLIPEDKHSCQESREIWSAGSPPWQHPYQKTMRAAEIQRRQDAREEEAKRREDNLHRSPMEDVS